MEGNYRYLRLYSDPKSFLTYMHNTKKQKFELLRTAKKYIVAMRHI